MTRFARARGSKSCNVKQPEEPTSWAQMKKAMESNSSKEDNYMSAKAALNSVKNRKDDSEKPAVWGALDNDDPSNALGFLRAQLEKRRKIIPDVKMEKRISKTVGFHHSVKENHTFKNQQDHKENPTVGGISESNDPSDALGFFKSQLEKRKKNKDLPDVKHEKKNEVKMSVDDNRKKGKKIKVKGVNSALKESETVEKAVVIEGKSKTEDSVAIPIRKKKKSKKQKLTESVEDEKAKKTFPTKKEVNGTVENTKVKVKSSGKLNKKKASKRKSEEMANQKEDGLPETKVIKLEKESEAKKEGEEKSVNDSFKKKKKRKHEELAENSEESNAVCTKKKKLNVKNRNEKNNQFKKSAKPQKNFLNKQKRQEKLKNLTPEQRRRKPLPQTSEIFVNGESVKLQMFDGFYVTQEDAERLKKLKDDMIKKGLALKDINGAIKLERRRAEKALARLKKKVCFHCRKSGHALSECPEIINSHEKAMNVCYKCGSTEHTAYNCKVTHGNQFRFAECFICKEQGHIAKQCPDNPKGLYPRGGACNECGDVTHLKKDCPQLVAKKEEMTVTAGLRDDRMIEDLDEHLVEQKIKNVKPNIKVNKHVKF